MLFNILTIIFAFLVGFVINILIDKKLLKIDTPIFKYLGFFSALLFVTLIVTLLQYRLSNENAELKIQLTHSTGTLTACLSNDDSLSRQIFSGNIPAIPYSTDQNIVNRRTVTKDNAFYFVYTAPHENATAGAQFQISYSNDTDELVEKELSITRYKPTTIKIGKYIYKFALPKPIDTKRKISYINIYRELDL